MGDPRPIDDTYTHANWETIPHVPYNMRDDLQ